MPGGVGVTNLMMAGVCVGGTRVEVGRTPVGIGMGVRVGVSRTVTGVNVEVGSTTTGVDVGGTGVEVGGTRVGTGLGVGVTRLVGGVSVEVGMALDGVSVDVGTTMTIAGVFVAVGAMMMIAGVSVGGATCPFGAATAGSIAFASSAPTNRTATKTAELAATLNILFARIGLRAIIIPLHVRGVNSAIDGL